MSELTRTTEMFEALARVLLRCWLLGFLLLLVWFGAYMLAGESAYRLHREMFELPSQSRWIT